MKRYFNKLKKLIYSDPESNCVILSDQYSNVKLNIDNTNEKFKVLNDIYTPNVNTSSILINNTNLTIGNNDNSINLKGNIGINSINENLSVDVNTTDGIKISKGTTNERPTYLEKGIIRYNTELDQFEGYGSGNVWGSLGGSKDVNQDTFIRTEKTAGVDNNEIEFYTSNIERMIIKDDGKIGIGTNNPNGIFEIYNKLLITENKIEFKKQLLPYENDTLNIGDIDKKISELFLAKDSVWIDDLHHFIVENDELKLTKRKTNIVPQTILDLGGTESEILTFTSKNYLSNISSTEWLQYAKTFDNNITLKSIFNNEINLKSSAYTWYIDNQNIILNKNNIGIGTTQPNVSVDINKTDAIKIPKGTTNERPILPEKGYIRYNTELDQFEGYGAGNAWGTLGGITDVNQDTFIRTEKAAGVNNDEIEFYTSNVERMIIKDDGKVGINVSFSYGNNCFLNSILFSVINNLL